MVERNKIKKYTQYGWDELKNAIKDGVRDFSNCDLFGANFEEANLENSTFKNSKLYWSNFIFANLSGADLSEGSKI